MSDLIDRQAAIDAHYEYCNKHPDASFPVWSLKILEDLPSAQPERLTDDDFETIRIHLNAYKEKLCNQHRWEEADEYQRIIDRFMAFASAQPDLDEVYAHAETEAEARYHAERKKGRWIPQDHNKTNGMMSTLVYYYPKCSVCGHCANYTNFCPNCGADMREGAERRTDD